MVTGWTWLNLPAVPGYPYRDVQMFLESYARIYAGYAIQDTVKSIMTTPIQFLCAKPIIKRGYTSRETRYVFQSEVNKKVFVKCLCMIKIQKLEYNWMMEICNT